MPVQLDRPLELDDWQAMLRAMDGDATTFHAHATAFAGNGITDELQCVLAHFGDHCATAVYAVRTVRLKPVDRCAAQLRGDRLHESERISGGLRADTVDRRPQTGQLTWMNGSSARYGRRNTSSC